MTYIVKPSFLILSVFFKLMGCFLCIFIMFFFGGEEDEVVPNLPSEIAAKSPFHPSRAIFSAAAEWLHPSSSASIRKLTGRNPSLQEIMTDFLFFIHPS